MRLASGRIRRLQLGEKSRQQFTQKAVSSSASFGTKGEPLIQMFWNRKDSNFCLPVLYPSVHKTKRQTP
jgi:hypothetical protein